MATPRTGRPRGRPPGSLNRKTLRRLMIASGQEPEPEPIITPIAKTTPLEVMLENLEWARGQRDRFINDFEAAETAKEKLELIEKVTRAIMLSHNFAKDAAPYLHPRLQATAPAPSGEDQAKTIEHEPYKGRLDDPLAVFRKVAEGANAG